MQYLLMIRFTHEYPIGFSIQTEDDEIIIAR